MITRYYYVLSCARPGCHTFRSVDLMDLDPFDLPDCPRCGWPMEIVRAEETGE